MPFGVLRRGPRGREGLTAMASLECRHASKRRSDGGGQTGRRGRRGAAPRGRPAGREPARHRRVERASRARPSRAYAPSGLDKRVAKLTLRLGDNKSSGVLIAPCDKAQGVRDDNGESAYGCAVLAASRNGEDDARSPRDDRGAACRRRLPRRDSLARAARDRHLRPVGNGIRQLRRPKPAAELPVAADRGTRAARACAREARTFSQARKRPAPA